MVENYEKTSSQQQGAEWGAEQEAGHKGRGSQIFTIQQISDKNGKKKCRQNKCTTSAGDTKRNVVWMKRRRKRMC